MTKIAIVRLTSLGDVVFASFIPSLIKQFYKQDIEIDWICDKVFERVIEDNKNINSIKTVSIRDLKNKKTSLRNVLYELKIIKLSKYDIVIDFQGTLKSAIVCKMIASKNSIIHGFSFFSAREWIATLFYNQKHKISYKNNIVERNLHLANKVFNLNLSYDNVVSALPTIYCVNNDSTKNAIDIKYLNKITLDYKKIALYVPFSSKVEKNISFDISKQILQQNSDTLFVVNYSGKKEQQLALELVDICTSSNILNITTFTNSLSINQIKSFCLEPCNLGSCNFAIGCDSGITHLANFCGLPVFVIAKDEKTTKRNFLQWNKNQSCSLSTTNIATLVQKWIQTI